MILSNYAINKNVLSAWPGPDSILGSGTVKNKTPEEVQKLLTNTVIEVTLGTVRVTSIRPGWSVRKAFRRRECLTRDIRCQKYKKSRWAFQAEGSE